MHMLNRYFQPAALCSSALLLCFSLAAHADEIQDINKLFKQGQHEQALERSNAYLAGKPKDAQVRFLKGLILTEQGKTHDAIRVFSDLTEDYPELPEPYNNLAVLYASQGQYDRARTALEMAIRTHPSYATAHENLGDIYAKMASQAYDRALQLDRSNTGTQTKLAMIKDLFGGGAKDSKSGKTTHTETPIAISAAKQPTASDPAPSTPIAVPEVAAPATPAPDKPATGQAAAKETDAGNTFEVLKVVSQWAAAWSSKNVQRYLAFYAADFKTPGGESRSNWEAQRLERIGLPKSIQVGVNDPKVKLIDDSHASVSFKQSYRASHLNTSSSKTLVLVKSGGSWLIQEERSGK